jgi:hypothetical protein
MDFLGWQSRETASAIRTALEISALILFALLVVFEGLAHWRKRGKKGV